jgi:cytidylate kinase
LLSLWERYDEEKRRYLVFLEAAYYWFGERGNVVTASRGGPFFLRGSSHVAEVRIMAPFEVRVRRFMEKEKVDLRATAARAHTYARESFAPINYLFGLDWTPPDTTTW